MNTTRGFFPRIDRRPVSSGASPARRVSAAPKVSARGFSIVEMMIGMAVMTLVGSAVFSGLSQVLLFSAQDNLSQQLRNDLLLSMARIRRDIQLSTNVVPRAGSRVTNGVTLVLRQPVVNENEQIVDDEFRFVTYTVIFNRYGKGGLLREVWPAEDAGQPEHRSFLNEAIVGAGFLFGGKPITQVANLTVIKDLEVILVSGRETGLPMPEGAYLDSSDFSELVIIEDLLRFGLDFPSLRRYIDYINASKVDVMISTSMGTATLRNKKVLGLETPGTPVS